jgi:hypothetical protein
MRSAPVSRFLNSEGSPRLKFHFRARIRKDHQPAGAAITRRWAIDPLIAAKESP